ncbi:MAG TPA: PaaX family transcriptional regulator C-terminal domain-containing protein [Micromonosporaceae bacterium]|jgi:phenylacetic acid degradation operon negative regulatory protein
MADPVQPQPRALIVTVYGLYARVPNGAPGWLPVGVLVRLLAELGVAEPAVRSAISRLKRRGLLVAERSGGTAGYALSGVGAEILREGDERIFGPHAESRDGGWLLAVFSVPEAERAKRHTLRSRLAGLGFGAVAPGVWIAPAHRRKLVEATLRRLSLESYVDLFRADYLAFADLEKMVGQWWDLAAIAASYLDFLDRFRPVLDRGAPDEASAFADWVRAVTAWRRLPYLDPGLPAALLPADWPEPTATRLFAELNTALAGPAHEHVRSVG